jgi:hypothetical protein
MEVTLDSGGRIDVQLDKSFNVSLRRAGPAMSAQGVALARPRRG